MARDGDGTKVSVTERIRALRDALEEGLVERAVPMRLALLAALAGEHVLLVGPPGTAKSLMARRLRAAFRDATYFERLLTRFSVPEELFGPLSVKGLEEDRYQRLTAGYLPEASVAFLDEVFKANSAILNALLTLLNERVFHNGTDRTEAPLVAVIGASNELPEGEELAALYDRFLLRCHVGPVSEEGFAALLALRGEAWTEPDEALRLGQADLEWLRARAQAVLVPRDVTAMLTALRRWTQEQQLPVSDRRWRKVVHLLQVSAATNGRNRVSVWDGWLLQHCLWSEPEQREAIQGWYEAWIGATEEVTPRTFRGMVEAWEERLKKDKAAQSQLLDAEGRLLYRMRDGTCSPTARVDLQACDGAGEPLYKLPSTWAPYTPATPSKVGWTRAELVQLQRQYQWYLHWPQGTEDSYFAQADSRVMSRATLPPAMGPTRYSEAHVQGNVSQLTELLGRLDGWVAGLEAEVERLREIIQEHAWIHGTFAEVASARIGEQLQVARGLRKRTAAVKARFLALPRQEPATPDPSQRNAPPRVAGSTPSKGRKGAKPRKAPARARGAR